ncbi:MAG: hypothetical protein IAF08_14925, partial [Rhizobacter sp.]|nr:hypothetical protein [Chlorobiales bacterium]
MSATALVQTVTQKVTAVSLMLILCAATAVAQTSVPRDSPVRLFDEDVFDARLNLPLGIWQQSGNAAGLASSGITTQGRTWVGFNSSAGTLRRPQSPLQADVGKFRTEGWQPLGLWMASGKFEYARRAERGVNWSGV